MAEPLQLQFSGNTRGRLHGCDCPSGAAGGIGRRVTMLKKEAGLATVPGFDCGNILDLDEMKGGKVNSRCMIEGLAHSGINAVGVTARDLFYGVSFLQAIAAENDIDFLSVNIVDAATKAPIFDVWKTYQIGDKKVAVTSVTAYDEGRRYGNQIGWTKVSPDSVAEQLLANRPANVEITILLTDMSQKDLSAFLTRYDGFDLAVTSNRHYYADEGLRIGDAFTFQTKADARSIELISYESSDFKLKRLALPNSLAEDTEILEWLEGCQLRELSK